MPIYPYACSECGNEWELKLTMSEHSVIKDSVNCGCGSKAYQVVTPLNFRLQGEGWFGRDGGNNSKGLGYELTQNEMNKSKEDVLRMDDAVAEMTITDKQELT